MEKSLQELWPQAALIGFAFAAVLGYFVSRSSSNREQVYSGQLAQVFHYIGAGLFAAIVPTVITSLVLRGGFALAIVMAVSFFVLSFASLLVFAAIELPAYKAAQSKKVEQGWTEQDARRSGL